LCTSGTSAAKPPRFPPLEKTGLVGRGEHDAAHGGVVAGGREGRDQVVEDLVGEGVAGLGLVERDGRDARVGDVVAQGGVGHGSGE
jgi:hypothetical protein